MNLIAKVSLGLLLLTAPVQAGVNFDNVDDFISLANESNFDFDHTDTFSVFAWIKGNAETSQQAIFSKGVRGADNFKGWDLVINSGTNRIIIHMVHIWPDAIQVQGDTEQLDDGAWHHVGYTYDGSSSGSGVSIYLDGSGETEDVIKDTLSGGDTLLNDIAAHIGERGDGGINFNGIIEDVSVWNVELTSGEVSRLYNGRVRRRPLQTQPSGLVHHSPLDDVADGVSADGATFVDMSSNGNTGTGDDGANNTGLTGTAGEVMSYP